MRYAIVTLLIIGLSFTSGYLRKEESIDAQPVSQGIVKEIVDCYYLPDGSPQCIITPVDSLDF